MAKLVWRYSDDARRIIENVYRFCMEEKASGMKLALERVWDRTAALTGVSRSAAQHIVKQRLRGQEPPQQSQSRTAAASNVTLDDFDQGVVRRTIATMYDRKKILPTLTRIRTELKENIGYTGSKDRLRKELMKMNFSYSRCGMNRRVLMERNDVVLSRIRYLRKIKELRNKGYTVIYTDETYVHTNHSVPKCWQDKTVGLKIPFSKGERMIILHAGYEAGFVPNAGIVFKAHSSSGDYHGEMNHKTVVRWLKEKFLPNIPPKCVLIMDNAAYHNVQVDRCPVTSTTKQQISAWLSRHGIPWTEAMLKPELLELCKKHKQDPVYVIDELLAEHGHRALRLPPYHADLNPIELIWGNMKGYIARKNFTFNLTGIKELIKEAMASITAEHWTDCINHVKKIELEYWAADIARDEIPGSVIININDSDDDTETDTASEIETDTASEIETETASEDEND